MQSILNEPDSPPWEEIAPLLDEAMALLGETDRNALALRFFENKTAEEIGRIFKLNEAAAQKRVTGVSANSVHAAPLGLAVAVTATVAKGATISAAITALVKGTMETMAWLTIKFAIGLGASVLLAASVATVAVSQSGNRGRGKICGRHNSKYVGT